MHANWDTPNIIYNIVIRITRILLSVKLPKAI